MTDSKSNNYFLATISAIILLISRIIHPYGFSGLFSFDQIAFDFVVLLTIFITGLKNKVSKWLWFYFFYRYFNHLYYVKSVSALFYPSLWLSLLYFIVFFQNINLKQFIKFYKLLAIIAISYFYLQEFTYFTTGYRISGLIYGLPISFSNVSDANSYVQSLTYADRSASLFSEPAAFVQFLIPLLGIIIFDKYNNKNKLNWIIIIVVTLLISRSGNALVGIIVLTLIYIINVLFRYSLKIKILTISFFIIIGSISLKIYINSAIGEELLERQDEIMEINDKTSGFYRVFRGYFVFDEYSLTQKIFGIDDINIIEQITLSSIVGNNGDNNLYFNVIQAILLRTGIIGLFLFLMFLKSLWKNNNLTGKSILLCFFAYMFLTSHYFSSTMIFYLTLVYKYQQREKYVLSNLRK